MWTTNELPAGTAHGLHFRLESVERLASHGIGIFQFCPAAESQRGVWFGLFRMRELTRMKLTREKFSKGSPTWRLPGNWRLLTEQCTFSSSPPSVDAPRGLRVCVCLLSMVSNATFRSRELQSRKFSIFAQYFAFLTTTTLIHEERGVLIYYLLSDSMEKRCTCNFVRRRWQLSVAPDGRLTSAFSDARPSIIIYA